MSHKKRRAAHGEEQQHEPEAEGGIATAIQESAQRVASNVASTAGQAWDGASRGVQYAASAVTETAEDAWDGLRNFMRRYPFATFFAGVTLGALAALALERRWSHSRR